MRRYFAGRRETFEKVQAEEVVEEEQKQDSHVTVKEEVEQELDDTKQQDIKQEEQSSPNEAEEDDEQSETSSDDGEDDSQDDSDSSVEFQVSFRRRPKPPPKAKPPASEKTSHDKTLARFEHSIRTDDQLAKERLIASQDEAQLASVDDTDGLDPDKEYTEWEQRERARMQRELDELAQKEQEAFEREHSSLVGSSPPQNAQGQASAQEQPKVKDTHYHKGGFFQDVQQQDPLFTARDYSAPLDEPSSRTKEGAKGRSKHHRDTQPDTPVKRLKKY